MRKLLSVLLLAMFAVTVSAQNGRDIYNKYSDEDGVSAVYISKSMFRLIGKLPDVKMNDNDVNLSELVNSLDGFYLIECSSASIRKALKDDVEKYAKSNDFELLMETKSDDETVKIFIVSKGDEVKSLVMLVSEVEECTFLCMDGSISRDKLDEAMALMLDD